ncbi:MAG: hypothetical protein WDA12_01250 [Bacilli bacterium]
MTELDVLISINEKLEFIVVYIFLYSIYLIIRFIGRELGFWTSSM